MTDMASLNLPSRDFEVTSRFYETLGFAETWRDDGWMILKRGDPLLEFFPHPELDPATSGFSCCFRLRGCRHVLRRRARGRHSGADNRLATRAPAGTRSLGGTVGALIDPDGSLIRLIQTED